MREAGTKLHLKKLSIFGFKSFAEPVEMEFSPGVTVVVGPNGSGKSNVLDAIRWCLGEQSSNALRGDRQTALIFAGSAKQKPLGVAEVSLTFDNSSGRLPLDFAEVTITRRLDRGGAGEYAINRVPCRLRDVWELLAGTGLGPKGLAIIGQGKLEEVLTASQEERRGFLEDLAGIDKYRKQKKEVSDKLEDTEKYICRAEDNLTEMRQRLGTLEKEAGAWEAANHYRKTERDLRRYLAAWTLREAGAKFERAEKKLQAAQDRLQELQRGWEEAKDGLARQQKLTERLEREAGEQRSRLAVVERDQERAREAAVSAGGKLAFWLGESNSLRAEIGALQESAGYFEVTRRTEKNSLGELGRELSRISRMVGDSEHELAQVAARDHLGREEARERSKRLDDSRSLLRSLENQASLLRQERQFLGQQKEAMLARRKRWEQESMLRRREIGQVGLEHRERELALAALNREAAELDKKGVSLGAGLRSVETACGEHQKQLGKAVSRLGALRELEENLSGYNQGVRFVLEAAKRGQIAGIHGIVGGVIRVEKGLEKALEVALGAAVQDVVVETDEAAKRAVAHLKAQQGGRATFLPLNTITPRPSPTLPEADGVLGWAKDLVKFDPVYAGVVSCLLGRVLVTEDLERALALGRFSGYRYKIVTRGGEILHPGGSITGGSWGERGGNLLRRRREQEELADMVENGQRAQHRLERRQNRLRILVHAVRERLEEKERQKVRLQLTMARSEESLRSLEKQGEALQREGDALQKEAADLSGNEERLTGAIADMEASLSAKGLECATNEEETALFLAARRELEERRTDLESRLAGFKLQEAALRQREAQAATGVAEATREAERVRSELAKRAEALRKLEANLAAAGEEREAADLLAEQIGAQMERLRDESLRLEERLGEQTDIRQKDERACRRWEQDLAEEGKGTQALRDAMVRLETEFSFLQEQFRREAGGAEDLEDGVVPAGVASPADAQTRLEEIRIKLAELGPVNPLAGEEHQRLQERYDALNGEAQDLARARGELLRALGVLDRRMAQRFSRTFGAVRENFAQICRELFGGGEGELRLRENAERPMEQELEIMVQPPGKKWQGLDVLSGGERSMVAIAFLFSLAKTKLAPFYILDEVEAALDESNVVRYNRFLQSYGGKGQFLIVTHQRQTMEAADVIYGVTMEPGGGSRVLSLRLADEPNRAQAAEGQALAAQAGGVRNSRMAPYD